MELIVDNQIVNVLIRDIAKLAKEPCLFDSNNRITFRWPSLLEYLGLGSLLSALPTFDQNHPIFQATLSSLYSNDEKEVIFYIYDRLFAENLTQIKALPQMNADYFLHTLQKKRENPQFLQVLSSTLADYEKAFSENASQTLHDLILYLAWDRMCVWIGSLFNYQSNNSKYIHSLAILKECLIESYQHITHQGRTRPSFYRLMEALFFFQMRDENISKHAEDEWTLLCQSFPVLKGQNELMDLFYIDEEVTLEKNLNQPENSKRYLTLDSFDLVNARFLLTEYMLMKLKKEVVNWEFILKPKKVISLSLDS